METTRMPNRPQRVSRICFTLNNYTDDEHESIKTMNCKWLVVGKELAPKSGTPHLQGAIVLSRPMTFQQIKNLPGLTRAHVEQMKGSCVDSLTYCTKEDPNAFVIGTMPQQGKRTDLIDCATMLNDGKPMIEVARMYPSQFVRYHKGLTAYRGVLLESRDKKPVVIWIHGPSGTGKTRAAVEVAKTFGRFWMSNGSLKWFDGYNGECVAILDDIREDSCPFNHLLRLLDRYPHKVEFKGGFVEWIPSFILITAPCSPKAMYSALTPPDRQQLERRIDEVLEFPKDNEPGRLFSLLGVPWDGGAGTTTTSTEDKSEGSDSSTMVMSSTSSDSTDTY